jgi:hypothetical protein
MHWAVNRGIFMAVIIITAIIVFYRIAAKFEGWSTLVVSISFVKARCRKFMQTWLTVKVGPYELLAQVAKLILVLFEF